MVLVLLLSVATVSPPTSCAQDVASSQRSLAARARARAALGNELAKESLEWGAPVFVRIFKEEMELEVWLDDGRAFRLLKTYPICTYGSGSLGPKTREGDGQAPEGFYFVKPDGLNSVSQCHLAFNLGYPNAYDRAHGRSGSSLMVHGDCCSIGCFAMTDLGIEEIYSLADAALRGGQPFFRVHVFPFRMTPENMERHQSSRWYAFWENLQEGHDFFERNGHRPPDVTVREGRYRFAPCAP